MSGAATIVKTTTAEETEALGESLAQRLRPGDVVLLSGELGAGKTTLVRGMARGLGVDDRVTSPTFTIGQRYRGARGYVAHIDLYRVGDLTGEVPGLLDEYLDGEAIALVEWPRADAARLGPVAIALRIEHAGGDRRAVVVEEGAET